jgi:hypothetical protein
VEYLSDPRPDQTKLRFVLESGGMDGHFKSKELYDILKYLQVSYSQYITLKQPGTTVKGNPILAFVLHRQNPHNKDIKKSKILFTGAHHARELLSATIVLKIFIESLHSLIHNTKDALFWKINDLVILPLVNYDSHNYISESYGTANWRSHKLKRKNMNDKYCP